MKKIIILSLILLASCGVSNQSSECNKNEQFIINSSTKYSNIIEEYQILSINKNSSMFSFRFIWNDSINKFNIGDTLVLVKK